MVCKNCGKEVPMGNKFCTNCGWKVQETDSAAAQDVAPASTPVQETAAASAPAQEAAAASEPAQEVAAASAPAQDIAPANEPTQDVTPASVPVQQTIPAEEPAQDAGQTTLLTPDMLPGGMSVQPAAAAGTPVQNTAAAEEPAQDAGQTTLLTPDMLPGGMPAQQAAAAGTPVQQAAAASTPVQNAAAAGAPVQQTAAADTPVQQTVPVSAPAQEAAQAPKKAKGGKNLLLIGAIVVAALVLLLVNASALTNIVKRTFSSPEKYYQWVEKNTAKEAASSAASIYAEYLLESLKVYDTGLEGSLSVELGEAGQDMLSLSGAAGVDLSWLSEANVSYSVISKDKMMQTKVGVGLEKEDLLSLEAIVDVENEAVFLAIPELSKSYIGAEGVDAGNSTLEYVTGSEDTDALELLQAICEKLPEEKQAKKLLERYFDIVLGCMDDVDMTKGKTLRAEGVSQSCTRLEVTIDGDTLQSIVEKVTEALEDDQDVKEIIENLCDELAKQDGLDDLDSEEVYEYFQEACSDLNDEAQYLSNTDAAIIMTVYVDGKGIVRGRKLELKDSYDSFVFEVSYPHKGSSFGFKAAVTSYGDEYALTGTGKDSGGKITGNFSAEYNGAPIVDIAVKKFDVDELKKGYLNGEFTVKAASGVSRLMGMSSAASMLSDMELTLNASMSAKANKLAVSVTEDKELWGKISISANRTSGKKVSAPAEKKTIYIEDYDDFEEYWDTLDFDPLLKKLDKIDVPSEFVDIVEEMADMDPEELISMLDDLLYDVMYEINYYF